MSGSILLRYERLYYDMCAALGLHPAPKWTAGFGHIRESVFHTTSFLADVLFVEPPRVVPFIRGVEIPTLTHLDEFKRLEVKDHLAKFIHDNRFRSGQEVANEFFYLLAIAYSSDHEILERV
jgi:hypothetical protein